jgi:hypothetical protein
MQNSGEEKAPTRVGAFQRTEGVHEFAPGRSGCSRITDSLRLPLAGNQNPANLWKMSGREGHMAYFDSN